MLGIAFAFLSAIMFSLSNILARKGLEDIKNDIDKDTGQALSLIVSITLNSTIFIIYYIIYGLAPIIWQGLLYMILAGVFSAFLGRQLLFMSVEKIGSSRMGSLKMTSNVFTILFSVIIIGERVSIVSWLGIMIVFLGVYSVSVDTKKTGIILQNRFKNDKEVVINFNRSIAHGILLAIMCGALYGISNVFRKLAMTYYPEPVLALLVGAWAAFLCIAGKQIVKGEGYKIIKKLNIITKSNYFWYGLTTSVAQLSILSAFIYTKAVIGSSIAASESLITVILAFFLLGKKEALNIRIFLSACIIFIGVILIVFSVNS